ncbi:hypothetical protein FRZ67_16065 [Panacibacter ginsenosidivorans]|uniref:Uncharacterized protein n=1 Tax=Panacibacter ginsenosidivorans TaxID=1813871 RepID=A0A5B8VDM5_9BACT|nr:hypothetical protein [Panacibacter ginsenosidivorans]QEC68746.1 hypothetical protein FRZ67_16065 [Panacibacter ginsenosidivorans]
MDLKIVPFSITIQVALRGYRMKVEQCHLSNQIERFTISAGSKYIIFESDRPASRLQGLKKRKPQWKLRETSEGLNTWNQSALDAIKDALWSHIKSIEQPPFNWDEHPKNKPY